MRANLLYDEHCDFEHWHNVQDQELHIEAAADAQTDEAYTMPREVVSHSCYPLPPNLYQYER